MVLKAISWPLFPTQPLVRRLVRPKSTLLHIGLTLTGGRAKRGVGTGDGGKRQKAKGKLETRNPCRSRKKPVFFSTAAVSEVSRTAGGAGWRGGEMLVSGFRMRCEARRCDAGERMDYGTGAANLAYRP